MPAYDFYSVCPVVCINSCHLDFRCRKWAQVLADIFSVHFLFPCLRDAGNLRWEGTLFWQLHARKVEQHENFSWVFTHICLKKHKYIICNVHNSDHLQLSFHWLHQGRKAACSTGYIRSLKNLGVSITKKESHWIWQLFIPLLALCYLPDTSRTLRKSSWINQKVSI